MSELDAYDYDLPRELIAQEPLPRRADARLLVVERARGELSHRHVRDLPEILRRGDLLVLNDTRVVPARLIGHRTATGGRWEGLFLNVDEQGLWRLLARGRGKMTIGETVTLVNAHGHDDIRLRLVERADGGVWIMHAESDSPTLDVLDRVGRVPLPPYIRQGEMVPADRERYQTVLRGSRVRWLLRRPVCTSPMSYCDGPGRPALDIALSRCTSASTRFGP